MNQDVCVVTAEIILIGRAALESGLRGGRDRTEIVGSIDGKIGSESGGHRYQSPVTRTDCLHLVDWKVTHVWEFNGYNWRIFAYWPALTTWSSNFEGETSIYASRDRIQFWYGDPSTLCRDVSWMYGWKWTKQAGTTTLSRYASIEPRSSRGGGTYI